MTPKQLAQLRSLVFNLQDKSEELKHYLVLLDVIQDYQNWPIGQNHIMKDELDSTSCYGSLLTKDKLDSLALEICELSYKLVKLSNCK